MGIFNQFNGKLDPTSALTPSTSSARLSPGMAISAVHPKNYRRSLCIPSSNRAQNYILNVRSSYCVLLPNPDQIWQSGQALAMTTFGYGTNGQLDTQNKRY
jgi:hypothetical protein